METGKKRTGLIISIIFLVILAALYAYLYLIPEITGSLTETSIVQYGSIQNLDQAKCIVMRDEYVVTADNAGNVSYYAGETEKTRKDTVVADIYPEVGKSVSYSCGVTGFVSYYIDGYENYFNPDTIGTINPADYADLDITNFDYKPETVVTGNPLYKVITSNTWYMLLLVNEEEKSMYRIGTSVTVKISDEFSVKCTVSRFFGEGENCAVLVYTKIFYEEFAKLRTLDVEVITDQNSGLIVPTTALCESDGQTGVMVLGINDEYTFKAVTVLSRGESETLIKEDENVKLYDEVLRNANSQNS